MAIQTGALREGEPHSEINTTPLIDVMLVLLVMLIVALPPQRHAIKLDTPRPTPPKQAVVQPQTPITINVDFDSVIYWNGQVVSQAELERRMIAEAARPEQAEVHIQPHRLAKYKTVAAVMGAAQRNGIVRMGVLGGT